MDKIGRYEIVEKVGSGGMAQVYLASDPYMHRRVAIKMMSASLTRDPEFHLRFEREAQVIAALEHEYIIPVYDFGYFHDQPYLVMRYMMGGSLKERVEDYGPLSLSDAAVIMERMADALEVAHQRGLVHRDFKPENILLDTEGDTFLADFGIVRIVTGGVTTGGWIAGTPAYMAPEQVHGDAGVDGRADVYAMGVTLYELLSGRLPYWDPTPTRLMMKHVLDPVPALSAVLPDAPTGVVEVTQRAMAKDPNDRYPTPRAFSEALNGAARTILTRRARRRWTSDALEDALDELVDEDSEGG